MFKASAVLAPGSFVLTKEAHLMGGFAAYGWFGDNPHAGEFVFTLGGYHPAFKPPDYYPVEPRVGINWQISDKLAMIGGAYLAITPTAMMAGAALQVTFNDGPLSAWLKASADAILYYKPFYLIAEAAISIGVSYRLDVLFIHKTISVEIGADFQLWGPPIGGRVHINWYIISFTIGFGADEQLPSTISWDEFKGLLPSKTEHPAQHAPRLLALADDLVNTAVDVALDEAGLRVGDPVPTKVAAYLTINTAAGLISTRVVDGLTLWLVRAEQLQLTIGSAIPASSIVVSSKDASHTLTLPGTQLGVRRVNGDISKDHYQSTQTVTILALSSDTVAHIRECMATTSPCTGQPAGCNDSPIDITCWDAKTAQTGVPEAMYGNPIPGGQLPDINSKTATIPAVTGLTLAPKPPTITNCTPEMVIDEVFDDRTVNPTDVYRLPLSQTLQPSSVVAQAADSFPDIARVNDQTVAAARDNLFAALQGLGVNSWTNNRLPKMAETPGLAFADEPLEGSPVTTPIPALVS
jgi:hypothetical protein